MNPWALLIGALLAFTAGWQVRDWKAGADQADQLQLDARDAMRKAERVDQVATGYETQRAATAARARIIRTEVERVVEVYRDRECLDADGLRLVAQAIGAASPASGAASAVP